MWHHSEVTLYCGITLRSKFPANIANISRITFSSEGLQKTTM